MSKEEFNGTYDEAVELSKENVEVWKKVFYKGKETRYFVSNFGNIYSSIVKRNIGSPNRYEKTGDRLEHPYIQFNCYVDGLRDCIYAHRVAYEMFKGELTEEDVHHKDDNTLNNKLYNLENISHKDNLRKRNGKK